MTTIDAWKDLLRVKIRAALVAKDRPVLAVLRETLAALDNAEAPPLGASENSFVVSDDARSGDIERLALSSEAVVAIIEGEIRERRDASATYQRLDRHDEANVLTMQADVLAAFIDEGRATCG
ncbi:hypothetical protein DV096_02305 [Bradymonadaceae bacterium TMQ3]|nr:hypothetical protein DV096_02305 [Bradymonadaceae bacterium TMQ3]TXC77830.1 hypothetical protein FRC91_03600 [Bradymonadales bacterium TMQ1]